MAALKKKERNSNFEFLRIISMFMIALHHSCVHTNLGNFDKLNGNIFNEAIHISLALCGKVGVICFILITGYFTLNSRFSFKKLLKLFFQVWFYSIVIGLVVLKGNFNLYGEENRIEIIEYVFFPILKGTYWFVSTYVLLYMTCPIMNIAIKNMTQTNHKYFLILLGVLFYVVPTFTEMGIGEGNNVLFAFVYFLGAYIRKYNIPLLSNRFVALFFGLSVYIIRVVLFILGKHNILSERYYKNFLGENSLAILLSAIGLFMFIKSFNFGTVKIINFVSQAAFGVYLIHDNNFLRSHVWEFFNINDHVQSDTVILYCLFSCVIIYISCTAIDLIRIYLLENLIFKITWFDGLFQQLDDKFNLPKVEMVTVARDNSENSENSTIALLPPQVANDSYDKIVNEDSTLESSNMENTTTETNSLESVTVIHEHIIPDTNSEDKKAIA